MTRALVLTARACCTDAPLTLFRHISGCCTCRLASVLVCVILSEQRSDEYGSTRCPRCQLCRKAGRPMPISICDEVNMIHCGAVAGQCGRREGAGWSTPVPKDREQPRASSDAHSSRCRAQLTQRTTVDAPSSAGFHGNTTNNDLRLKLRTEYNSKSVKLTGRCQNTEELRDKHTRCKVGCARFRSLRVSTQWWSGQRC